MKKEEKLKMLMDIESSLSTLEDSINNRDITNRIKTAKLALEDAEAELKINAEN